MAESNNHDHRKMESDNHDHQGKNDDNVSREK